MAKKKAAAKKGAAKKAGRTSFKGRRAKAEARRPAPKQNRLPGVEDFNDRELGKLAAGVAEERTAQSESKATEAGYLQAVHARMKKLGRTSFKAHGVEFARVPGDEKLRVRLTRGGGEEQGEDLQEQPEPEFETDAEGRSVEDVEDEQEQDDVEEARA